MRIFITGTDTNVGKTVISSWICLHTRALYYKPIQTGCAWGGAKCDRVVVQRNTGVQTLLESWVHEMPAAPQVIAEHHKIPPVRLSDIKIPDAPNSVIEGAGGVLVPLNNRELMIDLIVYFNAAVILVSRPDLGTISHTLLSLAALRQRNIPILGIIMNKPCDKEVAHCIEHHSQTPILLTFPRLTQVSRKTLQQVALPEVIATVLGE